MSKMSELVFDIQDLLVNSDLSFEEIAAKLEVPTQWVLDAEELLDEYDQGGETDDAYALASAGFGTDEDYGGYEYDYCD